MRIRLTQLVVFIVMCASCGTEPIGVLSDASTDSTSDDTEASAVDLGEAGSDSEAVDGPSVDGGELGADSSNATFSPDCIGDLCFVPKGQFLMGSPEDEAGRKRDEAQTAVELTQGFFIGRFEVTQADWADVASGRDDWNSQPAHFEECGSDCPVESINWWETLHYLNARSEKEGLQPCYVISSCDEVRVGDGRTCGAVAVQNAEAVLVESPYECEGYRLPTEAEWEYAYRAGSMTAFYNGDISQTTCGYDAVLDSIGWYCGNSDLTTHPVGEKLPNALGLFDMAGNVFEWCWDDYGPFKSLRGGDWHFYAKGGRAAYRFGNSSDSRTPHYGFRVVRTAP